MLKLIAVVLTYVACCAAAFADSRIRIDVYMAAETYACGPQGYRPPPSRCRKMLAKEFDEEGNTNLFLLRSGILIPPSTIKWRTSQMKVLNEYQLLGPLETSRRKSGVIVFKWGDRPPSKIRLKRTSSFTGEPYEAVVGGNQRTFFHLPLQFLDPTKQDRWRLTADDATYDITFQR